ncbi:MAG: c-type cytochrome [Proteobacteria bacterium]|nr:c-type cytochrome [Pseudomonadota bacterium]
MRSIPFQVLALLPLLPLGVPACGDNQDGTDRLGGDTTVDDRSALAFTHPLANLDDAGRRRFELGRGPFDFAWDHQGLGPLFNNNACVACHGGNGRGLSQIGQAAPSSQALVRCSLLEGTPEVPGGVVPVPGFGTQLQDHASTGLPEAYVELNWVTFDDYYDNGTYEELRDPRLALQSPNGAPFPSGMLLSYRQAPPVFGLGLLDAVSADTIRGLADPDDLDGDGISGRANEVWDPVSQTTTVGRFGHKASAANLQLQTAGAFAADMGLPNRIFHDADNQLDVQNEQLDDTVFFVSTIAVPAQAPMDARAQRGSELFDEVGCASCHVRTLETGDHAIAALANQTIHPFTDLLLHDVGDRLTDSRPDFLARGIEWRTPPLWGIGLAKRVSPDATFLHDGRARTLAEAILWHGGEAAASVARVRALRSDERAALIAFLETL